MREMINVEYELDLINKKGDEIKERFSIDFDTEYYNEDTEGIDVMMVNFRMQDLVEKYGKDIFLVSFSSSKVSPIVQ